MKKIYFLFSLIVSSAIYAQDPAEEELRLLIKEYPSYVSFNDSTQLDPGVYDVRMALKKFLAIKHENISDYYVGNDRVVQTIPQGGEMNFESILSFPIYHIDTFKALLQFKKDDPAKYKQLKNSLNPVDDMVGNASGRDGLVRINLSTLQVEMNIWK